MRLSIAYSAVVVVAVLVSARTVRQNDRGSPTSFAFVHATVIDGTGAAPKRDQTVLVTGARITAIGNFSAIQIPPSAQMLDGRGKFLIPGLWDMQVHIRGGKDLVTANEAFLTLYVANGVTGIREMGGDLVDTVLQWRGEIAEGTRLGPQIITAGPKLDGPRPQWPGSLPIATAADARDAVAEVKRKGADFLKIYSGVPREAYFTALDQAKKLSLTGSGLGASSCDAERTRFPSGERGRYVRERTRHSTRPVPLANASAKTGEETAWNAASPSPSHRRYRSVNRGVLNTFAARSRKPWV